MLDHQLPVSLALLSLAIIINYHPSSCLDEGKETTCPFKSASINSSNTISTPLSLECTNYLYLKIMSELNLASQILSAFPV